MHRVFRGLTIGLFVTIAGLVLSFVLLLKLGGGANEHDHGTIVESLLYLLCMVLQWPITVAGMALPDKVAAEVPWLVLTLYSSGCWGLIFELSVSGIKALKSKFSAPEV